MVTDPVTTGLDSAPAEPRSGAKARRTRARLLAAAREIFDRNGFVETRVADIASAAGASHGTFYTYFTSKDEIFRNLAIEVMDEFERSRKSHIAITDAESAYKAVYEMNQRYAKLMRDNASVMAVWRQAASVNTDLRDLLRAEDEMYIRRAERGILRFRSLGFVGPVPDDRHAARALGSMVKEFCSEVFIADLDFDFDTSVRTLTNIWAAAVGIPIPPAAAPSPPSS